MQEFKRGDRVRVINNPFGAMAPNIKVGMQGTVTNGGIHCIGVDFGRFSARAWMVADANGNRTVELVPVR